MRGLDRVAGAVGEDHGIADLGVGGLAELERRQVELAERLDEAEAGLLVVGERMGRRRRGRRGW